MRERVLLLHGWGGSDYPHWQSWLAGELAKDYGTIAFPLLDNPHFPSKNRWLRQVKALLDDFKPHTVICHSLANNLWYHLCAAEAFAPVERLLLVAPPRLELDIDTLKTFFPVAVPDDLHAKKAMMVTSTTDPYLNTDEAEALQRTLGIPMHIVENGGHLNAESGYGEWPWILEWVKNDPIAETAL